MKESLLAKVTQELPKRRKTYVKNILILAFTYDEILARDKTSLGITWLKDKSLADLDNLPGSGVLAEDIIDKLEAGLESFRIILVALKK